MTTVFVDLVNLDGSRPEGRLRFSLEQLRVGDPDVVPSSVEVVILDGKARVENLLPGEMKVQVNTGRWSKEWPVVIPDNGTHDLFDLLGVSAPEFEETAWAALSKRVEALEQMPPVDLAPLEDATRNLDNRVAALEGKPEPQPFDPTELKTQLAALQAHLTPVELLDEEAIYEDVASIYDLGSEVQVIQHAGRVDINISAFDLEGTLRALNELRLPHFPKVKMFPQGGFSLFDVELYSGGKFIAKLQPHLVRLQVESRDDTIPSFAVEVDNALAVVQETGANRIILSTFYYTNDLPPETD